MTQREKNEVAWPRARLTRSWLRCMRFLLFFGLAIAIQPELLAQASSWILYLDSATESVDSIVLTLGGPMASGSFVTHAPVLNPVKGVLAAGLGSSLGRYHVIHYSEPVNLAGRHGPGYRVLPNYRYSIPRSDGDVRSKKAVDPPIIEWSSRAIDLLDAHKLTRGDSTVTIGILDTGIDFDHPAFRGALRVNKLEDINGNGTFEPWSVSESRSGVSGDLDDIDQDGNGYVDDVAGFDFVDQVTANLGDWSGRDGVPTDQQGHGTQVAGVIGGTRGVAPGCRILPLRAFDATGDGEDDDIAAAIIYAADNGVDILNFSFGDLYRSPLLADAVRYAESRGLLMVGSSGNNGISDPHYPSGFSSVMSIGATGESGTLSVFSAFGSQLSMVAPGENILTTTPGGDLRRVSGTSFAAPHVAGTAALILSRSPRMTADEIWVALENSAKDRGPDGWDIDFGAGLLDADNALMESAGGLLRLVAPSHDSGISTNDPVPVIGSVVGIGLTSWRVYIGRGETPDSWEMIGEGFTGVIDQELCLLTLADFPDTVLTLRLEAAYSDGRTNERRSRIYLDRSAPKYLDIALDDVWIGSRTGLFVSVKTDDPVYADLLLTDSRETEKVIARGNGRIGLSRINYWVVDPLEVPPGELISLDVRVTNPAGLQTAFSDENALLTATMPGRGAPTTSFASLGERLPYGYIDEPRNPASPFLLLNRFVDLSFSQTELYKADGVRYDSIGAYGNWVPRGIGDSDGDGLLEALLQSTGTGLLTEQNDPGGSLFSTLIYDDTTSRRFYPGAFYDVDGDGRDEILGYGISEQSSEQLLTIWRLEGPTRVVVAEATNPTTFPEDLDRNAFGASDVHVGDVNGDGKPEFLVGDSDGDFLLYTFEDGNRLRLVWSRETDGIDADRMIAFADLDGDGRDEVLFGTRSSPIASDDNEYEPPLWSVSGLRFDNTFGETPLFRELFDWPRSTSDFRTGISAGDLDGLSGEEVVMTLFPTAYVFTWDPVREVLLPLFAREGSMGNDPFILPKTDSVPARVLIGDGRDYHFYALDTSSASLLPPADVVGWSLDQRRVFLRWSSTDEVASYRLFRSARESNDDRFFLIGETDSTIWIDSVDLDAGAIYEYLVIAVSPDNVESRPGSIVTVIPRIPTQIAEANPVDVSQIRVRFSAPMRTDLYRTGSLSITDADGGEGRSVLSILAVGDSTLLVSLANPASGVELVIRPTELMRDRYLAPLDTSGVIVQMPTDRTPARFFASSATPDLDRREISITFSRPVETAGLNPTDFTLAPPGTVESVRPDPADPTILLLTPEREYPLGPLGYTYTIRIGDIESIDGDTLPEGPGSIVGFTIAADQLDSVSIFPQPYSISSGAEVLILAIPLNGEVSLYTQTGRLLREVGQGRGDGVVRWDGRDERGEVLLPGVYLLQVRTTGERGEESAKRLLKFAVIP